MFGIQSSNDITNSFNVFPIAYLDHIKEAKPKSALLSINVIGATGFDTHSVKFVFSFFL